MSTIPDLGYMTNRRSKIRDIIGALVNQPGLRFTAQGLYECLVKHRMSWNGISQSDVDQLIINRLKFNQQVRIAAVQNENGKRTRIFEVNP